MFARTSGFANSPDVFMGDCLKSFESQEVIDTAYNTPSGDFCCGGDSPIAEKLRK